MPPSRIGWRPGEKRATERWETDYLAWALADFSGYLAIDELYDGPFCVLSMVDNRTFKRLFYQVLVHDPTHADMLAFFQHFQAVLHMRGLAVHGITTDGSPLYPAAIAAVFGPVPHQLCEFHILKDLNQAVLRPVAQVRKQLAEQQPHLKRGWPTREQRPLVHKRQRLQQTHRPALAKGQGHGQIADLFEYRHLFVQRQLTPAERATLQRITRGFAQLRALREIVEEVYRLFDRRCRTATALTKLARLRPTSNAVERGNRRYRKMQKTVYRVRTAHHIADRLALDLIREMAAQPRASTLALLHAKRTSPKSTR
ncbi:MAG TPA: transposase [Anaerolineae bacterium]|nr:transposase [Anaerolineae bacterium]